MFNHSDRYKTIVLSKPRVPFLPAPLTGGVVVVSSAELRVGGDFDVVVDSVYLSAFLNLRLYSESSEVTRLCVALCKRMTYRTTAVRGFRAAVTLIGLNLIRNRANDRRRSLGVSHNSNDYTGLSVSYRHVTNAASAMVKAGLLELSVKGFTSKTHGNGLRTRYKATPAFFDVVQACGVTPAMVLSKPTASAGLIVLNSPKDDEGRKHPVKWPNKARAQRAVMVANLGVINTAIRESFVALHVTDDELTRIHDAVGRKPKERAIDFQEKGLGRIFHDSSPKKGGRFYNAWWQSVPQAYRKHIHIATADDPTPAYSCELDYKAMHPRILYAMANEPCPDDPYQIYGTRTSEGARRVIKTAFMCIINNTERTSAIRAVNTKEREYYAANVAPLLLGNAATQVRDMLPPGCPPIPQLLADIEKAMAPIAKYFYTGIGKDLMYKDSQVAEGVMLTMLREAETIALPVHDSFIVRAGHEAKLEQVMKQKFYEAFGFDVPIKHDITEPQQAEIDAEWGTDDPFASDNYGVYDALVSDWNKHQKRPNGRITVSDKAARSVSVAQPRNDLDAAIDAYVASLSS